MSTLKYTHAVVCRIPKTYGSDIQNDYPRAKFQHECYVKALRDTGIDVVELPADEAFPMCAFVEDTAVCCNGIALITRPGNHSRLKEVTINFTYAVCSIDIMHIFNIIVQKVFYVPL